MIAPGPRLSKNSRASGRWAERVARDYLTTRGLRTLSTNYRFRGGEIDLIMRDGDTIVFVEVRYRRTTRFGSGAETITQAKRLRVIATARHYLQHTAGASDSPCRFDVIAISDDALEHDVEWIPDAFDA